MFGPAYSWLAPHARFAAARLRRRWGLLIAIGAACGAIYALTPGVPSVAEIVCAAATCPAEVDSATGSELPRTVLRFWLLLPQLASQ